MITSKISSDQVQAFVHQYWHALMDKTPGEMEKLYTYDSTIFNPFAQRTESGRVSAARKEREYFESKTSFRAEVTSPIEVMLLSDDIAVATYTFRWQALGVMAGLAGKRVDKMVRNGRATEVITRDLEGVLRIVHQHHSDIWRDTKQV
jgi:ketosteroid isomerase-like protein